VGLLRAEAVDTLRVRQLMQTLPISILMKALH